MSSEDRGVPCAPETEASVLSYLLSEGPQWWQVLAVQAGTDPTELFWITEHRLTARAMMNLVEAGSPSFTASRVADEMLTLNADRVIDNLSHFLIGLQTKASVTTQSTFRDAVATLVSQKTKRDQLQDAEKVQQYILTDPSATPASVSQMLREAAAHKIDEEHTRTIGEIIREMDEEESGPWAIPTGLEKLDRILGGGLEPGRVYVLAARSKVGKTTVAINITANMLFDEENDVAVAFVSLETLQHEFYWFMLAVMANVDRAVAKDWATRVIADRDLDSEDRDALHDAKEYLLGSSLYPMFSSDLTNGLASIENRILTLKSQLPETTRLVVFVDHAQLLSRGSMSNGHGIREAMVEATSGMKRIATDNEVPIVLISQVNRGEDGVMAEVRELSESQSIEQDADAIILINRPSLGDENAPRTLIEFNVARLRTGPPGRFEGVFEGASGVITADLDDDDSGSDPLTISSGGSGAPSRTRSRQDDDGLDDLDYD